MRDAVRAVVLDPGGARRCSSGSPTSSSTWWTPPGGGVDPGEPDEHALRRELLEECGLVEPPLGPLLWEREHWFAGMPGWGGQRERHYLVSVDRFEPAPQLELVLEGVLEIRWWRVDELDELDLRPRRLAEYLRELLTSGPRAPFDAGV